MCTVAARTEQDQDGQVAQGERLGVEDGLEEGEVDEGELGDEGDRNGEEEHLVGCAGDERDVETTSLEC